MLINISINNIKNLNMKIIEQFDHLGKKQDKEHFKHLVSIALADGIIDTTETDILHRFGRKMGFTEPEIDDLLESGRMMVYNPPYEFFKRFEQVYEIVKMVLADGIVDKNEMRLANSFATKSGFTESEIPKLLVLLISGIREGKDEEELFEIYKKQRKV
jgi:uncharacterized tellurite resistance protein B-like protein